MLEEAWHRRNDRDPTPATSSTYDAGEGRRDRGRRVQPARRSAYRSQPTWSWPEPLLHALQEVGADFGIEGGAKAGRRLRQ